MLPRTKLRPTIRDEVWKELFRRGFRDDLQDRLVRYQPAAAINACTGGRKANGLKAKVNEALLEIRQQKHMTFQHYTCGHPSALSPAMPVPYVPPNV